MFGVAFLRRMVHFIAITTLLSKIRIVHPYPSLHSLIVVTCVLSKLLSVALVVSKVNNIFIIKSDTSYELSFLL